MDMPLTRKDRSIQHGDIDVRSTVGSISGNFVAGAWTSLETEGLGTMNVSILPCWDPTSRSHITTSTEKGDLDLVVMSPIENCYDMNPLVDALSYHTSVSGDLRLHYPLEWEGAAVGVSQTGQVDILDTNFDEVARGDLLVAGKRGTENGSQIFFSVLDGNATLRVC